MNDHPEQDAEPVADADLTAVPEEVAEEVAQAPEPAAASEPVDVLPEPEPEPEPAPEADLAAEGEAAPESDAHAPALARIEEQQAALLAAVGRVAESTGLLARDREMTDRLHKEVQTLRRGELSDAQAPLIRDVIRLTDDIERLKEVSPAGDDLGLIGSRVLEILARTGVEPFTPEPGDPFDPAVHNGVRRVPTSDETQARTIDSVVRPGFRNADGRLVRAADVEVRHFDGRTASDDGGES